MPPAGGKTIQPGFARGKQANRPAGDGNAPLLPPAAASPPEGEICSTVSFSANLSCSLCRGWKTSPSGGSTAVGGDRGAFPTGASPVGLFSFARQGGCLGLIKSGGRHYFKAAHRRGKKRHKAANHRNEVLTDESKGITPESAGSRKLEADCLHLYPQRLLPAHWYLIAFLSYASRTEILHFVQNDA